MFRRSEEAVYRKSSHLRQTEFVVGERRAGGLFQLVAHKDVVETLHKHIVELSI